MQAEEIERLIRAGLPGAEVLVKTDDGRHWAASVISEDFRGKTRIQQHQLVYKTLGDHLGGALHALQLTTKAPE